MIFFALLFKTVLLFTTSQDLLVLGYGFSKGEEAVFPHPAGDLRAVVDSRSIEGLGSKEPVIPFVRHVPVKLWEGVCAGYFKQTLEKL